MRTITASEFKAKCLKLMDEVNATGEPVLVTKNGRPVSKLVPVRERKSLFGVMAGCVTMHGDPLAPVGENWEAESDSARHPRAGVARGRKPKARS
ncbi:MAG: type II toxin-antitoxin system Phd/YefM family antitoxin [Thermoanaerobaculia bacterium]|jgi:prevent-host-death family protein